MKNYIFLFPGQGSQKVGMGKDLYEKSDNARKLFNIADNLLNFKISELCFNGPEESLILTKNSQPGVILNEIIIYEELRQHGIVPIALAGHSVGEYAAAYAGGVFDFETVLFLTRQRGLLMQEASEKNSGSMVAVMGKDLSSIYELCENYIKESDRIITIANYNSDSQVVISGEKNAVSEITSILSEKGFITVELKVSGAWHSKLMNEAEEKFSVFLKNCSMADPSIPIYANIDASIKKTASEVRESLIKQITSPVRWVDIIKKLRKDFPEAEFIECGPGKVLRGLMKNIDKNAVCYSIDGVSAIEKFLEF